MGAQSQQLARGRLCPHTKGDHDHYRVAWQSLARGDMKTHNPGPRGILVLEQAFGWRLQEAQLYPA